MPGVLNLCDVFQLIVDCLDNGSLPQQDSVVHWPKTAFHIVFEFCDQLYPVNEQFVEQNEHKDEHFFQSEIQRLSSQLTVKDEQIAELNQQLKQAQKLADQAQQLQLKTQLQLESEQQKVLALETELQQEKVVSDASANGAENKKGFWRRIFG